MASDETLLKRIEELEGQLGRLRNLENWSSTACTYRIAYLEETLREVRTWLAAILTNIQRYGRSRYNPEPTLTTLVVGIDAALASTPGEEVNRG